MKTYNDLSTDFYKFKKNNDFPSDQSELLKYFWVIPNSSIEPFQHGLDDVASLLDEDILNTYKSQFKVGSRLLGITLGNTDNPDYSVDLYRTTEYSSSFTLSNILTSYSGDISDKSTTVSLPNGLVVNLPQVIKHNTVRFTSLFDGVDEFITEYGLIYGEKFKLNLRSSNRLGNESVMGSINYKSGTIELIRDNTSNTHKFIEYYKKLLQLYTTKSLLYLTTKPEDYNYATISGNYTYFGGPAELVYSFDLSD